MLKTVLVERHAGQSSLPPHVLREGKVGGCLFQILFFELLAVPWAEVEDRRHSGDGGTLGLVRGLRVEEGHAPSQPRGLWLKTVKGGTLFLFGLDHVSLQSFLSTLLGHKQSLQAPKRGKVNTLGEEEL